MEAVMEPNENLETIAIACGLNMKTAMPDEFHPERIGSISGIKIEYFLGRPYKFGGKIINYRDDKVVGLGGKDFTFNGLGVALGQYDVSGLLSR